VKRQVQVVAPTETQLQKFQEKHELLQFQPGTHANAVQSNTELMHIKIVYLYVSSRQEMLEWINMQKSDEGA
jgi:hypothetical protein